MLRDKIEGLQGAIDGKQQGIKSVGNNATNGTLQASGTHTWNKNNSTWKQVELV